MHDHPGRSNVRMICWTFVGNAEKHSGTAGHEKRKNSPQAEKSTREYFKKLFFEGKCGCLDECFLLKSNLELWIHNHKLICFPLDYMEPQNEGLVQMIFLSERGDHLRFHVNLWRCMSWYVSCHHDAGSWSRIGHLKMFHAILMMTFLSDEGEHHNLFIVRVADCNTNT